MSLEILLGKQNPDGGWPYLRGGSWTEPTAYAVLALLAAGETNASRRGLRWIISAQRSDGGWAPRPGIDQSTWVTGLVALLPAERLGGAHGRAIQWLLESMGEESTFTYRLREWLLGNATPPDQAHAGWPWFPGTAAWVGPTSIAVLALEKESRRRPSRRTRQRVDEGREFLLARMCRGGGWNHGSTHALGYSADPYPETTGMALAALRGLRRPEVDESLATASRFLKDCRSADALNWLQLGLRAHGRLPEGYQPAAEVAYRSVPETALHLVLASAKPELIA